MENKFTSEIVDDLADKLLIDLTKEENKMILDEFGVIDIDIDIITKVPNIEDVEPMSWCLDNFSFELREDEVEESTPIDELLQNCDVYNDREVEVPKVVE